MTQNIEAMRRRILAVVSAICTTGYSSGWQPGNRAMEIRESFRFDDSENMRKRTGDKETFVMQVEIRRQETHQAFSTRPDPCDWSVNDIIGWIQELDEEEVAQLREPDISIMAVANMARLLDTIDRDQDLAIGTIPFKARIDKMSKRQIIIDETSPTFDGKWGAEIFFSVGRSANMN